MFILYRILKNKIQNIYALQSLQERDMQRKTHQMLGGGF